MGKRGPQPVDMGGLNAWEHEWNREFHLLRDGYPSRKVPLTPEFKGARGTIPMRLLHARLSRKDLWNGLIHARTVGYAARHLRTVEETTAC